MSRPSKIALRAVTIALPLLIPAAAHAETKTASTAPAGAQTDNNPTAVSVDRPAAPAAPKPEREAKNSIYAEGAGPGLFYSINYDRTISDFAVRLGIGYIGVSANAADGSAGASASFTTIPVTVSYLGIGSATHIFELGAGASILHMSAGAHALGVEADGSATTALGTLIIGYRMQPADGGFMLRTGISPVFGHGIFLPWPYLALGGTF